MRGRGQKGLFAFILFLVNNPRLLWLGRIDCMSKSNYSVNQSYLGVMKYVRNPCIYNKINSKEIIINLIFVAIILYVIFTVLLSVCPSVGHKYVISSVAIMQLSLFLIVCAHKDFIWWTKPSMKLLGKLSTLFL